VELQYGTKYFIPVTYRWSYSDGKDTGPTHVFNDAGRFQVNCTVLSYVSSFTNSTFVNVKDGMFTVNGFYILLF